LEYKAEKSAYLNHLNVSKPLVTSISQKREDLAEALHHGLEIVKSQPRSKVGNFECMSWLNGSFFGVEHPGFLKEEVKTYLMAPMPPFNSPTFFHRRIYNLRGGVGRGLKWSSFVQQMSGNNRGPFLSPGALPVKSYSRLIAKNCDLTKMGSQAYG
jgi:hypothetical protein